MLKSKWTLILGVLAFATCSPPEPKTRCWYNWEKEIWELDGPPPCEEMIPPVFHGVEI